MLVVMYQLSSLQLISAQHLPQLEDEPVHEIIGKPAIDLFIKVLIHIPSRYWKQTQSFGQDKSISGEFGHKDCHPEELENSGHIPLAYPSISGSHTAQMSLLAGIWGTCLEVKCFGNIVEFKGIPHLSTEIIFQMAIIGALRL